MHGWTAEMPVMTEGREKDRTEPFKLGMRKATLKVFSEGHSPGWRMALFKYTSLCELCVLSGFPITHHQYGMVFMKPSTRVSGRCRRCGTCCQKGGPALHLEDRSLVQEGKIPLDRLFTIRKGERVYDNVRDCLESSQTELIKIRNRPGGTTCWYYGPEKGECRIYENRPLECRVLKCWNTDEIQAIYKHQRLERRDLLEAVEGLWDLVVTHDRCCDMKQFQIWVHQVLDQDVEAKARLEEMVQYDRHFRDVLVEKSNTDPDLLLFLLGRPVAELLQPFGIRLK